MRDDLELLLQISRWQREQAARLGIKVASIMDKESNK